MASGETFIQLGNDQTEPNYSLHSYRHRPLSLKATKEKLTRTAKLSEEDSTDVDVGVTA
jgi:hypothetical protein